MKLLTQKVKVVEGFSLSLFPPYSPPPANSGLSAQEVHWGSSGWEARDPSLVLDWSGVGGDWIRFPRVFYNSTKVKG